MSLRILRWDPSFLGNRWEVQWGSLTFLITAVLHRWRCLVRFLENYWFAAGKGERMQAMLTALDS